MDYPIDEDMEHEAGYPEGAVLQNPLYTTLPPPAKTRTRTQEQLASLFETPDPEDDDIYTADLFEPSEAADADDLLTVNDDLLTVKRSDITGYPEDDEPRQPRQPHWSDEDIARREQVIREQGGSGQPRRSAYTPRVIKVAPPRPGSQLGGTR